MKNSGSPAVYVKENSDCSGNSCDGSGWGKAFKTLQRGVNAAKRRGKPVWLAEGNFVWNNGGSDLEATAQDPLFKSNAAAGDDGLFFTKDDGYALADDSPMIDEGALLEDIPLDIFQISRTISKDGSGLPDMGAREWFPDIAKNIQFLKKTATRGLQPVEKHTILKENSSDYLPLKLKNTPYAYVLSVKMPQNKYMKDSHSGTVRILTKDKETCGEAKNVTFYRIAEEDGLVEYRTYRKKGEGVYLFLSQREMPSYDWYHVLKVCEGGFHIKMEAYK